MELHQIALEHFGLHHYHILSDVNRTILRQLQNYKNLPYITFNEAYLPQ